MRVDNACLLVAVLGGWTACVAQQSGADQLKTGDATGGGEARQQVRVQDLPPPVRLGARVENARRLLGVIPTVVIVPDVASYVAAISKWDVVPRDGQRRPLGVRFPVLIDDGSWRAREDIARFVRSFEPKSVVRWSAENASTAWPKEEAAQREAIEASAYGTWGAKKLADISARWKAQGFMPPGVVVASTTDPAWTAALALAAGHGQVIAWGSGRADLNTPMTMDEARAFSESITKTCDASGFAWQGIGDEIDAVTICMNVPALVRTSDGDSRKMLATTDVVGRGAGGDAERRWAWAGQIAGDGPRAAYMAMCALFIQPTRAWTFDGYENKEPMSRWDASEAAIALEKGGITTAVNDNGRQGSTDWRNRASGLGLAVNADAKREGGSGVDAGFITVNTSGQPEFFDVQPGQCRAGDVPFLHVPAAVHFIHSFSAARPGDRATIAGRFMERGAFAYVGAVHEPYLQAFVFTPLMAARMMAAGPWGVSVRLDDAPTWKVAVFGDPLWTMGPLAPRVEVALPLAGAQGLQEAMTGALKEKRYEEAVWALVMLGRDADASRLMRLIDKDDAAAITPGTAGAGVMAVFRSPGRDGAAGSGERVGLLARLCVKLESDYPKTPEWRDILWHAAYPMMAELHEEAVRALAGAVRPEQAARDAGELMRGAVPSIGREKAVAIVLEAARTTTDTTVRKALEDVVGK